jgi:hypothetical protein
MHRGKDQRCGTCAHGRASPAAGLVDCACPLPYFLQSEFTGNLDPNDGRDCPAWK